jgi:DNA invertase Pin-like site-specific DNA recombinase
VLLSFAQFEREVIGERVRDKIAASKRKGLWVGGPVPLGYRCLDKKLEIVPEEAETVRTIFSLYPNPAPTARNRSVRLLRETGSWVPSGVEVEGGAREPTVVVGASPHAPGS